MNDIIALIIVVVSMHFPVIYTVSEPSIENRELDELMNLSQGHEEIDSCGYDSLHIKYYDNCSTNYLMDISIWWGPEGNMITGENLLEEISTTCSHYTSFKSCAESLVRGDCPEQEELAFESLMEKWSIFCDGDKVSEWLQEIMKTGFRYNQTCNQPIRRCYMLVDLEFPKKNRYTHERLSMSEGIDFYRLRSSASLKCLISEYIARSEYLRNECGTSWQDILLVYMLRYSTFPSMGGNIGPNEIKMLQEIRC